MSAMVLSLKTRLAIWTAAGFGSGYAPKCPGTAGTAACFGLWCLLAASGAWNYVPGRVAVFLLCAAAGGIAAHAALPHLAGRASAGKQHDPGTIVIDEWAGLFAALLGTAAGAWLEALSAFALFRAFDILKPWPVSRLERLPGAWGIMADDIAAGALAAAVLAAVFS